MDLSNYIYIFNFLVIKDNEETINQGKDTMSNFDIVIYISIYYRMLSKLIIKINFKKNNYCCQKN